MMKKNHLLDESGEAVEGAEAINIFKHEGKLHVTPSQNFPKKVAPEVIDDVKNTFE